MKTREQTFIFVFIFSQDDHSNESSPDEKKPKGRTGWPQQVWAMELKQWCSLDGALPLSVSAALFGLAVRVFKLSLMLVNGFGCVNFIQRFNHCLADENLPSIDRLIAFVLIPNSGACVRTGWRHRATASLKTNTHATLRLRCYLLAPISTSIFMLTE